MTRTAVEQFAALLNAQPWDLTGATATDDWRAGLWLRAIKNATGKNLTGARFCTRPGSRKSTITDILRTAGRVDDASLARRIYFGWKRERLRGIVPLPGVTEMLAKVMCQMSPDAICAMQALWAPDFLNCTWRYKRDTSPITQLRQTYGLALVTNGDSQVQHEKLTNWNAYVWLNVMSRGEVRLFLIVCRWAILSMTLLSDGRAQRNEN
jgi:hypothetical protein